MLPPLPKRAGDSGYGPFCHPALPPRAPAYPAAVNAGGIAERAVTAQACPARLTRTLAHGAASPVCREWGGRGEESHIHSCSPRCPSAREGLWLLSLSWDFSSQGLIPLFLTFLESPSLHLSDSISSSTFRSIARVIIPKHKSNRVSPWFKNA